MGYGKASLTVDQPHSLGKVRWVVLRALGKFLSNPERPSVEARIEANALLPPPQDSFTIQALRLVGGLVRTVVLQYPGWGTETL